MNLICRYILVALSSFPLALAAQQAQIDSVSNLLASEIHDTIRADALNKLSFYLYYSAPDSSLQLANQAMTLSQKIGFQRGIAKAHYQRGFAYVTLGENAMATQELNTSLTLSKQHGFVNYQQYCHNVLGILHTNMGYFTKALVHLNESLLISEKAGDDAGIATACSNIAKVYLANDDEASALRYYRRSVTLFEKDSNSVQLPLAIVNLSTSVETREEEEELLLQAIDLAQERGNSYALFLAYSNYAALLHNFLDQTPLGLTYYHRALVLAKSFGDPYTLAHLNNDLGILHGDLNRLDSAEYYFLEGMAYTEDGHHPDMRQKIAKELANIYSQKGRFAVANEFSQEALILADSIQSRDREELLANADAQYQLTQKEAEITAGELKIAQGRNARNRQLIYGLALLGITVAIFQYFFYRQRQRKRELDLALKAERAEADRLRDLDELKTRFFTNVSHELRTPLTLINSPLEEALKELKQVSLEPKLSLARRNTERLLELTNEILDLAKLEAGQLEFSKDTFLVLPQVRRIFSAFHSQAEIQEQSLQLIENIDDNLSCSTDFNKLEKILNNLLSNALKFTPAGGQITLQLDTLANTSSSNTPTLKIQVRDSGQGIHPDDLDRVFDRFYQSRHNESPQGGSGIGLALSKQLAGLLGGELKVESQWGTGSTFSLSLPLSTSLGEHEQQSDTTPLTGSGAAIQSEANPSTLRTGSGAAPPPTFPTSSGKAKVLIVEDNLDMSTYLLDSLKAVYDCQVANNGQEALDLLEQQHFDLITSDVMMPVMDGFALRAAINEREEWKHIPFILLTARTLEEDKLFGFKLGIDDYITKPFSLAELRARVNSLLRNKQSREQEWATEEAGSQEKQLLDNAMKIVQERLDDNSFNVEELASALNYSQRQLARVLGPLTGLSPVQFILEIRLQAARRMLEKGIHASVAEVRYAIGIESASYFSRKFKERFGCSPGEVST